MKELDDIRARAAAANAEMDRLTAGSPGTDWRWSIPANPERDSDLILSASAMDVPRLVGAIQAALEYVEYVYPDPVHPENFREIIEGVLGG